MTVISPPSLTSAQRALIQGAVQETLRDQPNGFVGLNGSGVATINGIIPRTGTPSELDELVLAAGEIATTSDLELRIGDGVTSGGKSPRGVIISDAAILVCPTGNYTANAEALVAAYEEAQSFTPGGFPLGPANRVTVLVAPGLYDLETVAPWNIDAPYIDIVGLSPIGVRLIRATYSVPQIVITASDVVLNNLYLVPGFSFFPFITISPAVTAGLFEDLTFLGVGPALSPSATGDYSGLTFRGTRSTNVFMGGLDGANASSTVMFDDCTAGNNSFFGGATAGGAGTFSGTIRNSRLTGTSTNLKVAGVLDGVRTKAPITRLVAGARFLNCVFDTSSDALQNGSSAVAVKANGCVSAGNLLGTSVTNTWSATNLQSAGTGLC